MYNGVYTHEQYAYVHDTLIKWLDMKTRGKSLGERLVDLGIGSVAIYGVNDYGRMVYEDVCRDVPVEAFIDRKADEIRSIDGIDVLLPEDAPSISSGCYILITPEFYFREIFENLLVCGIERERIISLAMVVA